MKKSLLLVGALLLCAPVMAADDAGFIRKSFNVAPGGKLTIRADRGSIDVKTAGSDKVEIEVMREPGRGAVEDILERHKVSFSQEGNNVSVKAEVEGMKKMWSRGNNMKVKYAVTVPSKYNVDLHTSGGSVSVMDLEGEARAGTSGGSLKFGAIKGRVHGRTSGGSISVNGATEDVDIETSGGGIHIGETGGNVLARTSGGSIKIGDTKGAVTAETSGGGIDVSGAAGPLSAHTSGGSIRASIAKQPSGPCSLETSGGSIEVKMASNVAVDLNAHTSGGTVTTDFPVTVQGELKKNRLVSKINGGGPEMKLGTSGGSIRVKKM